MDMILLELIQNADDNFYADGITPHFTLQMTSRYILVFNNEEGFVEKNVRALCNVGGSTKEVGKGEELQQHYIGHKGIGFKSVFNVSDTPHIFSR